MHKLLVILFFATAFIVVAAKPAQAAPPAQSTYGFRCYENTCRLLMDLTVGDDELPPDDIWLEFMQTSISQMPGTIGFVIGDAITLSLPNVRLNLMGAEVYVMTDESGTITNLYGSAILPVTPSSSFGEIALLTPIRIEFGYQSGTALAHLNAPLDPTQRYWHISAASEVQLALASEPTVVLSVLPGQRLYIVADTAQSAIWFDGQVTVHADGDPAALYALLNSGTATDELVQELFTRGANTFSVLAQTGNQVPSQLGVEALLRRNLGVPLTLRGQARINPDGLLVSGSVATDMPLQAFIDAQVAGQVFAPFTTITDLTASVEAKVNVPMFGIAEVMAARFGPAQDQILAFNEAARLGSR